MSLVGLVVISVRLGETWSSTWLCFFDAFSVSLVEPGRLVTTES